MAQLQSIPSPSRTRSMSSQRRPEPDRQRRQGSGPVSTRPSGDGDAFVLDWEIPVRPGRGAMTSYRSRPIGVLPGGHGGLPGDPSRTPSGELAIAIGRSLGTVVVTLVGSLDTVAATRLAATLSDLIDGQGNLAVEVDLGALHRVAPSGVQVISAAAFDLERRGGRLSLRKARDDVLRALELAGLARFVGSPLEEPERKADPHSAGGPLSHLQDSRARAAHPALGGRQGNLQGGRNDRP
jgi:anti-anti-sigma factor